MNFNIKVTHRISRTFSACKFSTSNRLVGAHVSAQGGVYNAIKNAIAIKAKSFALFTKSQRRWNSSPLKTQDIQAFRDACLAYAFHPSSILPHCSYLLNCGSPVEEMRVRSVHGLIDEINRAESLGLIMVNFHPGATLKQISEQECCNRVASSINEAHKATPESNVMTIIENTAGQGSCIGWKLEHLSHIISRVENKGRVGVCIDTCHAFSAGYDLRAKRGWESFMKEFEELIGLDFLKALHVNDSKEPLGSRKDRHESIGEGCIGLESFRVMMNDSRFLHIPMILETPNGSTKTDAQEIQLLHSLVQKS